MPRRPRVHVPGGLYHAILRGNHREAIFHHPDDYQDFEAIVVAYLARYEARLRAYCWMPNHVHLAIQIGSAPLRRLMQAVASCYARRKQRRFMAEEPDAEEIRAVRCIAEPRKPRAEPSEPLTGTMDARRKDPDSLEELVCRVADEFRVDVGLLASRRRTETVTPAPSRASPEASSDPAPAALDREQRSLQNQQDAAGFSKGSRVSSTAVKRAPAATRAA